MEIYERNNLHMELLKRYKDKDIDSVVIDVINLMEKQRNYKEAVEINNAKQLEKIATLEKKVISLNRQLEILNSSKQTTNIAGIHNKTSVSTELHLVRDYRDGMKIEDILEKYKISTRTLYKILERRNVNLRKKGEH
ncbi:MAG: hypothetical protein EWM50_02905 [Gottschalkiaceae bacterium]|nr:MAG: hypothetical protein EWM50_02905 [Gottschalkiaceae bacterium]